MDSTNKNSLTEEVNPEAQPVLTEDIPLLSAILRTTGKVEINIVDDVNFPPQAMLQILVNIVGVYQNKVKELMDQQTIIPATEADLRKIEKSSKIIKPG